VCEFVLYKSAVNYFQQLGIQKVLSMINRLRENSTVRFVLVGVLGAVVELFLFSGAIWIGLGIVFSNFFAFHCAFIFCYTLHYFYTHKKPFVGRKNILNGFFKYAVLMYGQLFVGSLLLLLLINDFNWMPGLAKIFQICLVTPLGFLIQKLIIFKRVS
jgi:putative flippase GtrA